MCYNDDSRTICPGSRALWNRLRTDFLFLEACGGFLLGRKAVGPNVRRACGKSCMFSGPVPHAGTAGIDVQTGKSMEKGGDCLWSRTPRQDTAGEGRRTACLRKRAQTSGQTTGNRGTAKLWELKYRIRPARHRYGARLARLLDKNLVNRPKGRGTKLWGLMRQTASLPRESPAKRVPRRAEGSKRGLRRKAE